MLGHLQAMVIPNSWSTVRGLELLIGDVRPTEPKEGWTSVNCVRLTIVLRSPLYLDFNVVPKMKYLLSKYFRALSKINTLFCPLRFFEAPL